MVEAFIKKQGLTLYFLESEEQVSKVRGLLHSSGDLAKAVALSPEAMDALDQMNQSYVILEDYYPIERLREIGEVGIALTERICDEIDGDITCTVGDTTHFPTTGMARLWFSEIKTLGDALSTRVFGVRQLLEAEMPASVSFYRTRPQRITDDLNFDNESVYSLVLPMVCESLAIPFTSLGTLSLSLPRRNLALWKRSIHKVVGRQRAGRIKFALTNWRTSRQRHDHIRGRLKVLLLFTTPELLDVISACRETEQYDIVQWLKLIDFKFSSMFPSGNGGGGQSSSDIIKDFARDMENLWGNESLAERLRGHFEFEGLDYWPLVESRFRHLITRSVVSTFTSWLKARTLLQSTKFDSVLASTFTSAQERAVALAARDSHVPVILYQHGGSFGWRPLPMHSHLEGQYADYFLAYGEGAGQHFADTTPPGSHQPKTIPTGSISLDRLSITLRSKEAKEEAVQRYGLDPQKKVILYVVDYLAGNRCHFPSEYPDTWYYAQQKKMIRVLAGHPEFQYLVKLGPGHTHNPLADYVRRLGADHINVTSSGRFLHMLPAADAVIIDYPSTPLDESVVTEKPVFVLVDRRLLIFDDKAMTMLGRRAQVSNDPAAFLQSVERYLSAGAPAGDTGSETEFLKHYGTHLGDGQSMNRVLAQIQSLTNGSKRTVAAASSSTDGV